MEFKITSTSPRLSRQAGFTLVELMIAAGLSGLLLAVCLSLALFTARGIASVTDSVDLNARSRHAIDRMGQKIRQASVVKSFSPTSVSLVYDGRSLTYTYYPNNAVKNKGKLVENDGGNETVLLENCDTLAFSFYKRNPVTNSFNQFPVMTATNEAKVIQVNWRCSRDLVGKTSGSSEMVSARFVIRAK